MLSPRRLILDELILLHGITLLALNMNSLYFKQATKTDDLVFYDEVDIKEFKENNGTFYYPCPCGDYFEITLDELRNGEVVARCPFCSLIVSVIYEPEDIQ
jgi:diphthamide biosynthesis protein 3